jgi:hypothetical protein
MQRDPSLSDHGWRITRCNSALRARLASLGWAKALRAVPTRRRFESLRGLRCAQPTLHLVTYERLVLDNVRPARRGRGPRQRARPELATPTTSSAWWRERRRPTCRSEIPTEQRKRCAHASSLRKSVWASRSLSSGRPLRAGSVGSAHPTFVTATATLS